MPKSKSGIVHKKVAGRKPEGETEGARGNNEMNGESKAREGMVVDFMYQFNWTTGCLDSWLNIIGGCVCAGVSRRD